MAVGGRSLATHGRPHGAHPLPESGGRLSAVELTRAVLAVAVGYVIFAGAGIVFFALSGRDPHASYEPSFAVLAVAAGAAYSALAGYVCAAIAGRAARGSMVALALTIALAAVLLLFVRPGEGAIWSDLAALLVFTPSALVGGAARYRQTQDFHDVHRDSP